MAALTDPFVVYPGAPPRGPGPQECEIRQLIEDDFRPAVEELERELARKLGGLSPSEHSKAIKDYDNALAELRQTASDQYYQLLKPKTREPQRAASGAMAKNNQPELTAQGEDRCQPPPVPDREFLSQKSIDEGGAQRPSTIPTEPARKDSPPVQPSSEDRKPRPYPSTGSWPRQSSGHDKSHNFGSPPLSPLQIWKPSSNESTSSHTLGYSTRMTRSRRTETAAPVLPSFKRDDFTTITSALTPDPPYSHTHHLPHQTADPAHLFTDGSRQPQWRAPPQTSDPRPTLPSNFDMPTWKHLINSFYPLEITFLIEKIFKSKEEVKAIRDLRGDDAQAFIDTMHEALDLPSLPTRLRGKCLSVLHRMCGSQALLPKSLQIPLCYNRSDPPLYHGGFADVWKGEHNGCGVAVKVLRVYATSDLSKTISRFCKEVVTWNTLRHPNVVPLLGVSMDNHHFAMVSEWMVNGNVNEFIKAHREANRFELLKDVAVGLIYIHDKDMIHGDLKGANILIDQNGHARLADFGLLTIVSTPSGLSFSSTTSKGGTTRWMSPELLSPDRFNLDNSRPTRESDCYALGMVIYEVLSGRAPYSPLKDVNVMLKVIEGEHPERPGGVEGTWFSDDLWKMLGLCWSMQPKDRPSVDAVLDSLKQVSGTWNPPPQQVSEDAEGEDDWDITVLSVGLTPEDPAAFVTET